MHRAQDHAVAVLMRGTECACGDGGEVYMPTVGRAWNGHKTGVFALCYDFEEPFVVGGVLWPWLSALVG